MAARRVIMEPGPAETATVATQQIGRDTAFVNEHVLASVPECLAVSPLPALGRDVSASLLVGVYGFFLP